MPPTRRRRRRGRRRHTLFPLLSNWGHTHTHTRSCLFVILLFETCIIAIGKIENEKHSRLGLGESSLFFLARLHSSAAAALVVVVLNL